MAVDFQEFAQQVARLAEESDTLRKSSIDLDEAVLAAEQELQRCKAERQETEHRLVELEGQQKALMGNVVQPAFTAASTINDNLQTDHGSFRNADARPIAVPSRERKSNVGDRVGNVEGHNITVSSRFLKLRTASSHNSTLPKSVSSAPDATTKVPKGSPSQHNHSATCIHPKFPTVVYIKGKWTDIACGHCGANAYIYSRVANFYRGASGLIQHLRNKHDIVVDLSTTTADNNFKLRVVSEADVALMKAGKEPLSPIAPDFGYRVSVRPTDTPGSFPSTTRKPKTQNRAASGRLHSSSLSEAYATPARMETPKRVLTEYEEFQRIESLSKMAALPPETKRRKIDNVLGERRQKQSLT